MEENKIKINDTVIVNMKCSLRKCIGMWGKVLTIENDDKLVSVKLQDGKVVEIYSYHLDVIPKGSIV